jgi:hypothetical protein
MENNKNMTAVEWLILQVEDFYCLLPVDMIEQAKQMEKEQMKIAYIYGLDTEQYYNETYGKD